MAERVITDQAIDITAQKIVSLLCLAKAQSKRTVQVTPPRATKRVYKHSFTQEVTGNYYISLAKDKAPRKGCFGLSAEIAQRKLEQLAKKYPQRTYYIFNLQEA
jgi:hypothetical protein